MRVEKRRREVMDELRPEQVGELSGVTAAHGARSGLGPHHRVV